MTDPVEDAVREMLGKEPPPKPLTPEEQREEDWRYHTRRLGVFSIGGLLYAAGAGFGMGVWMDRIMVGAKPTIEFWLIEVVCLGMIIIGCAVAGFFNRDFWRWVKRGIKG